MARERFVVLGLAHVRSKWFPEVGRWSTNAAAPIDFVVIPEYVARNWWERLLYNQSAKRLRVALLGRPHTVVVNVPYRRDDDEPGPRGAAIAPGT